MPPPNAEVPEVAPNRFEDGALVVVAFLLPPNTPPAEEPDPVVLPKSEGRVVPEVGLEPAPNIDEGVPAGVPPPNIPLGAGKVLLPNIPPVEAAVVVGAWLVDAIVLGAEVPPNIPLEPELEPKRFDPPAPLPNENFGCDILANGGMECGLRMSLSLFSNKRVS